MPPVSDAEKKVLQKESMRNLVDHLANAIRAGDVDKVNCLLDMGTLPNKTTNYFKSTILNIAVTAGNAAIVSSLLRHGANPNLLPPVRKNGVNQDPGILPLCMACKNASSEIVELLLDHGAQPNKKDFRGETCLFHGVRSQNPAIVRALLRKGARVDARNAYGRLPVEEAQKWCPEVVVCLQEALRARSLAPPHGSGQLDGRKVHQSFSSEDSSSLSIDVDESSVETSENGNGEAKTPEEQIDDDEVVDNTTSDDKESENTNSDGGENGWTNE